MEVVAKWLQVLHATRPFFSLIAYMSSKDEKEEEEERKKEEAKENSQFHFTAIHIIASSASSMIHWSVTGRRKLQLG